MARVILFFVALAVYGQAELPMAISDASAASPARVLPPMVSVAASASGARARRLGALTEQDRVGLPERATGRVRAVMAPRRAEVSSVAREDGSWVVRFDVASTGAQSVRLHFKEMDLGGGSLWVYPAGASREFLAANPSAADGPITGRGPNGDGEFWSLPIEGDAATVEMVLPRDPAELPFLLDELVHLMGERASTAPCQKDVNCYPEYSQTMTAVGSYDVVKDGFSYFCSGSLLVTRSRTFQPYFLTANHCVSTQTHARSVVVYWDFRTNACNGAVPARASRPSTRGARLLATGGMGAGDYTLLLLDSAAPGPRSYLGWSAAAIELGTATVGIHHPGGTPSNYQRVTLGSRIADQTGNVGGEVAPAALYWQIGETEGRTEGGSSGSPLMTRDGQVVGMLSYGPVRPKGQTYCDIAGRSGYGRFSAGFPSFSQYLNDEAAPGLSVSTSTVAFAVQDGVAAGAAQRVDVRNSAAAAVAYTVTKSAPWITLSAVSGSATAAVPGTFNVSVNPALLTTPGTFEGIVTVTAGALAPLNVTVRATVTFTQAGAAVSVAPSPVIETQPDADGFTFFYTLRVDETVGVAARITKLTIDGADRSADIVSFFDTDQVPAFGGVGVSLRARLTNLPRKRRIEVSGVTVASGRPWTTAVDVDFLPRPANATLTLTAAPRDVAQTDATANCRWRHELVVQETAGYSVRLNRWTADGLNLSTQIVDFFGSTVLPRNGLLRTTLCWPEVGAVPRTISFEMGGVDEKGATVTVAGSVRMVGATTSSSTLATSVASIAERAPAGGETLLRRTFRVTTSNADTLWSITPIVSGLSKDWISVNPQRGRGTATVTVTLDPYYLEAGTYNGGLIVESASTSPQFSTVTVQLEAFRQVTGTPRITGVVNGASFAAGAVAPGAWITVFGENLASTPAPGRTWTGAEIIGNRLPTSLDGTAVRIDGRAAAIYFVGPGQLNVQVPDTVTNGPVTVEVDAGGTTARGTVTLARVAPAIFQIGSSGSNVLPAAVDARGGLISLPAVVRGSRPAQAGELIALYGTGFGPTSPTVAAGVVPGGASSLVNAVVVRVGGLRADVLFAGLTGAGLNQINIRVPETLPPGNHLLTIEAGGTAVQGNLILPVN
jgi:uncharacterized protein (TIGR03437 family)